MYNFPDVKNINHNMQAQRKKETEFSSKRGAFEMKLKNSITKYVDDRCFNALPTHQDNLSRIISFVKIKMQAQLL